MDLKRFDGVLLGYFPLLAKRQVEVLRQDGEAIELSEYTRTIEEVMPKCTQRGTVDVCVDDEVALLGI